MTKRHYWLVAASILFTGLAIIQVQVGLPPAAPPQVAALPDGHTLRLERVAHGLNVSFASVF